MRKVFAITIALIFACSLSYGEGKKKRIQSLEERVTAIEEVIRSMTEVSETVDKNVEFFIDDEAPAVGEGKVVQAAPTPIHHCDALVENLGGGLTATWSVHSGAGVTVALTNSITVEGTGAIEVYVPSGVTAVVKVTITGGSLDLSALNALKVYLRKYTNIDTFKLYFGEAAYNEQSKTTGVTPTSSAVWEQKTWDISAIAAASRNGVTIFAVEAHNSGAVFPYFHIDYAFGQPGYGKFQAGLAERTATLMPPYVGTYTATATDPRTISVPRAGQIKSLLIVGDDGSPPYFATSDMAGKAKKLSGTVALESNLITSLGDGSFTVTGNMNNNGTVYYYQATFED